LPALTPREVQKERVGFITFGDFAAGPEAPRSLRRKERRRNPRFWKRRKGNRRAASSSQTCACVYKGRSFARFHHKTKGEEGCRAFRVSGAKQNRLHLSAKSLGSHRGRKRECHDHGLRKKKKLTSACLHPFEPTRPEPGKRKKRAACLTSASIRYGASCFGRLTRSGEEKRPHVRRPGALQKEVW